MSRSVFVSTLLMCGTVAMADCVAPPAGLVSWWKAESNALDSVNGVNNGVLMGNAGFAPGKVGLGFSLDGNGSYIRVPHDGSQTLTNELTIELWYKSEGNGSYGIFNKHNTESGPIDYGIAMTPGVRISTYFNDPTVIDSDVGGAFEIAYYNTAPASGAFHHLAATFKQLAANTVETRVYVDAQLVRARTFNASLARAVSTAPILIGATVEYPSYEYFKGIIDEVSLYGRALSSNEIAAIYQADSAGKCNPVPPPTCVTAPSGLVSWWKAESNALDSVNGVNNGVLMGNAGFAPGKVGLGFSLDGNGSYIRVPHDASQTLTNELTIELWYKSEGNGSYGVFSKHNTETGPIDYDIDLTPGVRIYAYFNDPTVVDSDEGSQFEVAAFPSAPVSGGFHHLAATFKQLAANTVETRVYVDAQLVRARTFNASLANAVSTAPILIGATVEYPSYEYFKGIIDEVSLYGRALSSNEIAAIYQADSAGKCMPVEPTSCTPMPDGVVGWWKGESNVLDTVTGTSGILSSGMSFGSGKVGSSFVFDGTSGNVKIPASTNLNVGAGPGFTLEAWVNPATLGLQPLFEWNGGSGLSSIGVHVWMSVDSAVEGDGVGNLYANLNDPAGNDHRIYSSAGVIVSNQFQHVALTYDKASGVGMLYCNGAIVKTLNLGTFTPQTTPDLYFGERVSGPFVGAAFHGKIDEPTLYNRALSSNEIAAIYNAGSAGKCTSQFTGSNVPVISGFSPVLGTNGAAVRISGTNFNSGRENNIVYFGAVRAFVVSASPTELDVIVPVGATYAPITVAVNGTVASSDKSFLPTFAGNGLDISTSSFAPGISLPTGDGPGRVVIADLDDDGRSDLAVANAYGNTISLFRNVKTNGSLDSTTFVREELQTAGGSLSPYMVEVADVDGDGKPDLLAVNRGANTVSVFRNISDGPLGTNSFAPR
ncbi:MAG TPA: LamG-like jellyroll fold domain-containing protein, partial [Candidatus Paceibacterota bacterium]|nr:LamG-like jellyroll fold domain-containing protein [Candidatus Paceibacterota bacterium]